MRDRRSSIRRRVAVLAVACSLLGVGLYVWSTNKDDDYRTRTQFAPTSDAPAVTDKRCFSPVNHSTRGPWCAKSEGVAASPGPGGTLQPISGLVAQERTLTVYFLGGFGRCGILSDVLKNEMPQRVAIGVLLRYEVPPGMVCPAMGVPHAVNVLLDAPLGDRPVVDLAP